MATQLVLNQSEAQTALWRKIKEHYEAQLELLRTINDGNLDQVQTALLRGRIQEIKTLLALDKLPPGNEIGDSYEAPIEY